MSTDEYKTQEVFQKWNSYKGCGYGKVKWKSHRVLSLPCQQAIRKRLRQGYSVETLQKAIDNYAKVLLNRDYAWTYAWSLLHFLVRGRKGRPGEEQLSRWLPGEFEADDYMTAYARDRRAKQHEQQDFVPATDEQKAKYRKEVEDLRKPGGLLKTDKAKKKNPGLRRTELHDQVKIITLKARLN